MRWIFILFVVALVGCGETELKKTNSGFDAGFADAGTMDAGEADLGGVDSGPTVDAGEQDAGLDDAGVDMGMTCPSERPDRCEGMCVDTQSDDAYCGSCTNQCAANETCQLGVCNVTSCSNGELLCDGACAPCPSTGVTSTDCDGATCVATSCGAGFEVCAAGCCARTPAPTGDVLSEVCGHLSLEFDSDGDPHVLVFRDGALRYVYWSGTDWEVETVASTIICGSDIDLKLGDSGEVHVAYIESSVGSTTRTLKYARRIGPSNFDDETITTWNDFIVSVELELDGSARPIVAFSRQSRNQLEFGRRLSANNWDLDTIDFVTQTGFHIGMVTDTSGRAQISYSRQVPNELRYATELSNGWDVDIVSTANSAGGEANIGASGNVIRPIHTRRGATGDVVEFLYQVGPSWIQEIVGSADFVFGQPFLGFLPSGQPVALYYDATTARLYKSTRSAATGQWSSSPITPAGARAGRDVVGVVHGGTLHAMWTRLDAMNRSTLVYEQP